MVVPPSLVAMGRHRSPFLPCTMAVADWREVGIVGSTSSITEVYRNAFESGTSFASTPPRFLSELLCDTSRRRRAPAAPAYIGVLRGRILLFLLYIGDIDCIVTHEVYISSTFWRTRRCVVIVIIIHNTAQCGNGQGTCRIGTEESQIYPPTRGPTRRETSIDGMESPDDIIFYTQPRLVCIISIPMPWRH